MQKGEIIQKILNFVSMEEISHKKGLDVFTQEMGMTPGTLVHFLPCIIKFQCTHRMMLRKLGFVESAPYMRTLSPRKAGHLP